MSSCTFFGHRDCPNSLRPSILNALHDLIETKNVSEFYLGNQGNFDYLTLSVLRELSNYYPHIHYTIVLAYLPKPGERFGSHSIFPEEVEKAPRRFAICQRNRWMIERADWVVAYVTHSWGGAAQFVQLARRKGKPVLMLPSPVDPRRAGAL